MDNELQHNVDEEELDAYLDYALAADNESVTDAYALAEDLSDK